jgi:UDP-N-acetylmuramate dehydrogenase
VTAESLYAALQGKVAGKIQRDVGLRGLTSYRLGGPAALYFEPKNIGDLEILSAAMAEVEPVDVLILGRGSNLVVSDSGWPGLVVRLGSEFSALDRASGGRVVAGGGASLPQLCNWAARRGLSGVEFAIAIPGSVGGGVRMNAGAHGGDLSQTLTSATVFDIDGASVGERSREDLGMTYRRSTLTDGEIVLAAEFELEESDPIEVKGRVEGYRKHRAETQPPAVQNAGSVFKNPPGDHAGRLVEAAGLKGFKVGSASVSELHANFFIAGGPAKAQDVYDLVHEVRSRVRDAFGITLEPEVRFVGTFEEHIAEHR